MGVGEGVLPEHGQESMRLCAAVQVAALQACTRLRLVSGQLPAIGCVLPASRHAVIYLTGSVLGWYI